MTTKLNIIIFRTDRLGDFIIHSRLIYELKKKFSNSNIVVVCSKYNEKIIKKFTYIDSVIIYNKNDSFFQKLIIFIKIFKKKYFLSMVLDGKKFSYLCNMLIFSRYKVGLVYKYYLNFFNFSFEFFKPSRFYMRFFLDYFQVFTSRKYLKSTENLCQKYINLLSFLNIKISNIDKYIFPNETQKIIKQFILLKKELNFKKYNLIHFDEKWIDIENIENDLASNLVYLQKHCKIPLVLTSFNNNFNYFKNLKNKFKYINFNIGLKRALLELINFNDKIIILDNLEIFLFEKFLSNSNANISCHSGFIAQVCGANSSRVIDIVNKSDVIWYSCWKPLNTFHRFIYKSNDLHKFKIKFIVNKLLKVLNKIS